MYFVLSWVERENSFMTSGPDSLFNIRLDVYMYEIQNFHLNCYS